MRPGRSWTGRWRLPRCQAIRTSASAFAGADLEQVLGLGEDADDAALLEAKAIALAQAMGRREVDEEIGARFRLRA